MNQIKIITFNPPNPKNGAYIKIKRCQFVTLYNSILDTYGVYTVDKDWSDIYWTPSEEYTHPFIDWESIWSEMDFCNYGYKRNYEYSISINGPEIKFSSSRL